MASLNKDACSVSAAYMEKNFDALKHSGMTEAQLARASVKGNWGVLKGKWDTLPDGEFLGEAVYDGGGKYPKSYQFTKAGDKVKFSKVDPYFPNEIEIPIEQFETYLDSPKWNFKPMEPVGTNSASVGAMTDEDIATLFVKTKDEVATAKGFAIKGVNKQLDEMVYEAIAKETGYTAAEAKAKVDAYKASGKKLSTLKKKTLPKSAPKPPPNIIDEWLSQAEPHGVPLTATKPVVEDTIADVMQAAPDYLDEDVAKAYIKAKDELAASPDNPWTLYTQNNAEFDDAIYTLMDKSYGIDLSPTQIKAQIAKYTGEGNKISVLKKKMAKSGEYTPQADTLKKKKGDPTGTGKQSKTAAQGTIKDAADAGYTPDGASDFDMKPNLEDSVFLSLKTQLYAGMSPENVYDKFEDLWNQVVNLSAWDQGNKKPSILQLVRAYDKKKAAQLGIPNGNFYEKKLADYASSPAGKAKIAAKKNAAELEKNLPPLPADSAGYSEIGLDESRVMQAEATKNEPWTGAQKSGLRTYTGSAYRDMNRALREGREKSSSYYESIKQAQKGMRPSPRKFLVHRGCDFKQFGTGSYEQALQLIGKKVQDKGFLSTSVGGRSAFSGSVNLEVEIPVGTHGAYVKSISQHGHENEYLIAAGTKYEVLTVNKTGYQTTIRVRAIPGSQTKGL